MGERTPPNCVGGEPCAVCSGPPGVMYKSARDRLAKRLRERAAESAARRFLVLWDAFMHPDCTDTFADCEEAFRDSIEDLRVELERQFS